MSSKDTLKTKKNTSKSKENSSTPPQKKLQSLKEKIKNFPQRPGVYFMKDCKEKVLYVGKAKNLKSRIQSYFSNPNLKTSFLLRRTEEFDYMLTPNEVEAFLLESSLIKKYQPRYNMKLKDDKSYPYLSYSLEEDFPRFELSRKVYRNKKKVYFGPYPNSSMVKDILSLIAEVFKIRDCSNDFMKNRTRPCLVHQIGRCKAPCVDLVSQQEYQKDLKEAVSLLKGKNHSLFESLEEKMKEASKNQRYEEAASFRDQKKALEALLEKQSVMGDYKSKDIDVLGFYKDSRGLLLEILYIRGGRILGERPYFFSSQSQKHHLENLEEFMLSFLNQYYNDNLIPEEIFLPNTLSLEKEDREILKNVLEVLKASKTSLKLVSKNNALMKISFENAKSHFEKKLHAYENQIKALLDIQKKFHLPKIPMRIECYDISHLQGKQTVASQVVFEEGEPKKQDYRKYKLESDKVDDYTSLKEVLTRRFAKDTLEPDLIFN